MCFVAAFSVSILAPCHVYTAIEELISEYSAWAAFCESSPEQTGEIRLKNVLVVFWNGMKE